MARGLNLNILFMRVLGKTQCLLPHYYFKGCLPFFIFILSFYICLIILFTQLDRYHHCIDTI